MFTDNEWKKLADPTLIPVLGKVQRYQLNVEARLDEDEEAIGLLDEQLLKPVVMEEKKTTQKKWYQFWRK